MGNRSVRIIPPEPRPENAARPRGLCFRPPAAAAAAAAAAMLPAAVTTAFLAFSAASAALIDGQAILPPALYDWAPLNKVVPFWVRTAGDCLMVPGPKPPWFQSLVFCELLLQLPTLAFLLYAIPRRISSARPAAILYGAHVATTLVPIFAHFLLARGECAAQLRAYDSTLKQNDAILIAAYAPFLALPALIAASAWTGTGAFADVPWPRTERGGPTTRSSARRKKAA